MGNITHTVGIVLCLSTESDPMKDPQIIRFLFRLHASAHYSGFYPMAECLYHLTETEEAMQALGELTGASVRDDVTERIFSRFCVGK